MFPGREQIGEGSGLDPYELDTVPVWNTSLQQN